ncbi:MAG: PAS domain-containing protein [Desulfomonile tiedjei]|nr:PAS domain-containing protein [Desulfomonile tiedjei]
MYHVAHNQYRKLLDALPCYVTLQDRDLGVLWSNSLSRKDFGDPAGKKCYELFGIDRAKCSDCPVQKTFFDGQVHSEELTLTTKSGSRINVIVHSSPLNNDRGQIVSAVWSAVNITSVKDIQKQMILLGQTVAGMAHSMKNIMMGLEGGIYVVNKGIEAKNQDEVKEGWDMVLFNFDKISHIVKDILYCSKEREPELQRIEPNKVVREVYGLFKDLARSYAIEIRLDLDDSIKDAIIDPDGLHTVLSNLITNAMDACKIDLWKDDHLIEIRTKKGKNGSVIFEVADNGIGIGKALKDHVFEDFFTSKGDKGTGLGLMVTQKILREHGGSITFRSRPGKGTTFVATFPFKDFHGELG